MAKLMMACTKGNTNRECYYFWDGGVLMDGREQKVGFAEKKLRLTQKMAHRVYQGEHVPTYGGLPKPTLRGSSLWLRLSPSCASGFAFRLHGEIHNTPSPMASLPLAAI
ncbi:MAG: hypothetical protein SOX83_03850 [Sodaliphilus sp.]|nr:hypothetical protein [Sodaliphilus sp.]